jgi:hypothetical protein
MNFPSSIARGARVAEPPRVARLVELVVVVVTGWLKMNGTDTEYFGF